MPKRSGVKSTLGLALAETEADGETLAEGDTDALGLTDGDSLLDGETEGLTDALGL